MNRPRFLATAVLLLTFAPWQVLAGPGGDVNYINASPYDWKLKYSHSYQMTWNPSDSIPSGAAFKQYVEFDQWRQTGDCAAEAVYELVGSPGPAQFTVMARQNQGRRIQIQYNTHLASMGSPENSLLDLGFDWDGAVLFVLSGDGTTPYIGGQPPTAWMQATLSTIDDKTLRQISMPLSHDAGMSSVMNVPWFGGIWHNTCTQEATVYQQLQYGARWFDIRPFLRNGEWFTGHFSRSLGMAHVGGTGRSIDDIVNDINTFTSQNPGELIVLDLSHELKFNPWKLIRWITAFSNEDWLALYDKLSGIQHLWSPSNTSIANFQGDFTQLPISSFIQPGSDSAVILRVPEHAPSPPASFPKMMAIIRDSMLPYTGSYSHTGDPSYLAQDQLAKLKQSRDGSAREMHRSTYTITQKGLQISTFSHWKSSIIGLSYLAHRVLLGDLWKDLSARTYPNLVEIDNIHNSQVAAMCMAINDRFANVRDVKRNRRKARGEM